MATRAEIAEELRHVYGKSYVSNIEVARHMGVNKDQAKRFLASVPYIMTGEKDCGKRYMVKDVAKMIFDRQVRR